MVEEMVVVSKKKKDPNISSWLQVTPVFMARPLQVIPVFMARPLTRLKLFSQGFQ